MRKMMNFQPTSRLMMKWMAFFIVFSGSASLLCATQWIKIATGLTLDWVWISDNKTCLMHSLSLFGILFSWINTYRRVICYLWPQNLSYCGIKSNAPCDKCHVSNTKESKRRVKNRQHQIVHVVSRITSTPGTGSERNSIDTPIWHTD